MGWLYVVELIHALRAEPAMSFVQRSVDASNCAPDPTGMFHGEPLVNGQSVASRVGAELHADDDVPKASIST